MIQRTPTSVLTAGGNALKNKIMLSGDITTFGPSINKYSGSCYYNGKMYLAPYSATQFAEVDLKTGDVTYFGTGTGYQGIVAHPNGYLYAIPAIATFFKKIDPVAKTAVNVGATATGYVGGCLAQNGKIYASPSTASQFAELDPATDTVVKFGTATRCFGINLAENGFMYTVPGTASAVYKVNPNTRSVTSFGSLGTLANKYIGGGTGDNNRIYLSAFAENQFAYIDTVTDTVVKFGAVLSGASRFIGIVKGYDGVYAIPHYAPQINKIDTATLSVSQVGAVDSTNAKYQSGIIDDMGRIACVPTYSARMQIHPTGYVPPSDAFVFPSNLSDLATSNYNKYFNKF